MRFATRTFLWVFIPFVTLMAFNFWLIRTSVTRAVRDGLRETVLVNQKQLAEERARADAQMSRILGIVAENPSLKAGLQLLADERRTPEQARHTVEDQLSEICDSLGFAFLMVLDPAGKPLAGIQRAAEGFEPMNLAKGVPPSKGLYSVGNKVYHVTSVPVRQGPEELGTLAVGEEFTLASLPVPAVLLNQGRVVTTAGIETDRGAVESQLGRCGAGECEVRMGSHTYLSVPLGSDVGIQVRSLQDVDAASASVLASLRSIFITGTGATLLAAGFIAVVSSGSIVRPLAALVHRLNVSTETGSLQELPVARGGTVELRELTEGFNQAAKAIRQGREKLVAAYVEFTGSLAQALDARDPYTSGHSQRVSEYAVAIGRAMNLPAEEVEILRVGALLHDIGKIGVADAVLQKPGKLTPEEEAIIRQHPTIGRRILEGVHGLEPYIPVVELHHENWDGGGYPQGLKGGQTPLVARIVKVADAYDAMTTDRPYRKGISHEQAVAVIEKIAGEQTDAEVVRAFRMVSGVGKIPVLSAVNPSDGLANLAAAVESTDGEVVAEAKEHSRLLGAA